MAIAGLQNVSVLDSSFLRDSQSDAVRSRVDDGRVNARASSLLRMWRELEDEHGVSHGQGRVSERLHRGEVNSRRDVDVGGSERNVGSEDVSGGETESENGQEDGSSDLGEMERERVRQIFREWMSSGGGRERTAHTSRRNGSRAEWLGETEQERVRIIREWVQRNTRQGGARFERGDDHGPAAGQIEQVLDSLNLRRSEGQTEHARRGIRRVCGRQALLDMLKKAERERQIELQGLLEHRAVTRFAHRHRIQSLLRGRFLRNNRMIETERPRSTAARELGLLRQRNAVADLRRSVSTLLRSGFRESLDQLIRSYVERQTHANLDWDETSPSLADQELDENPTRRHAIPSPPPAPPLPPTAPSQRLWDRESQNRYQWPHQDMNPRFGIEWDIINDMRIDMARMQQRMNNMQRMLEACMDMQLELQRSIRQEVSAALNRSPTPPGAYESPNQNPRSFSCIELTQNLDGISINFVPLVPHSK
ncbi:hypothetical protein LINGRAHAP2_LOCUS29756 [Linum grandiflorum]